MEGWMRMREERRKKKRRTYNDAGGPGVEQENGADQEGAGQHHADGQQEPVPEANVLLPEQEGVSIGVVEDALAAELVAHRPHALNGLHEVAGLAEAIQVEGELGKLQRLCSRDYDEGGERGGQIICGVNWRQFQAKMMCLKDTYCADSPRSCRTCRESTL